MYSNPFPFAEHLDMHSNPSLSGTIPDSLGSLSQLVLLSGTIPDSLGSLSGTIPDSLGILDQLVHLDMHSNPSLSGTIPDMLSGTVPDSLGSLEWHPTRQPRKPQPASVARHVQQPFAEWHRTRQPRKPQPACVPRHAQQPSYMHSNPLLSGR
eukprot:TRINITY_DN2008_c0_g1_i16.p1 TRINITY_DN2008_c0_g1~~TRINITY_DN2008_c0_g1_i16.p1  ORF type:complete len:153 (+),score=8.06 TRINITY_DN2008_c0_g1_i16:258-716(+)